MNKNTNDNITCCYPSCRVVDFLPLQCSYCLKAYCNDHLNQNVHGCDAASWLLNDKYAISCDLCETTLYYIQSNKEKVLNDHSQVCPGYRLSTKRNCIVLGCNLVTGPSSVIRCTKCNQYTCLKHKYYDDHNCESYLMKSVTKSGFNLKSALNSKLLSLFRGLKYTWYQKCWRNQN